MDQIIYIVKIRWCEIYKAENVMGKGFGGFWGNTAIIGSLIYVLLYL